MSYVVTLFGILASGVVATLVTSHLNGKRERVTLMRSKIEDLYLSFNRLFLSMTAVFIAGYPLMKGEITRNDYNDIVIKRADSDKNDGAERTSMLIDIYFPNLKPAYDQFLGCRDQVNKLFDQQKVTYKDTGQTDIRLLKPFHHAMQALNESEKTFRADIIAEAAAYTRVKSTIWPWH